MSAAPTILRAKAIEYCDSSTRRSSTTSAVSSKRSPSMFNLAVPHPALRADLSRRGEGLRGGAECIGSAATPFTLLDSRPKREDPKE